MSDQPETPILSRDPKARELILPGRGLIRHAHLTCFILFIIPFICRTVSYHGFSHAIQVCEPCDTTGPIMMSLSHIEKRCILVQVNDTPHY